MLIAVLDEVAAVILKYISIRITAVKKKIINP
jgi:hypothetical protein